MKKQPKKLPKKTDWCEKKFKCLTKNGKCDCKVTSSIDGYTHFVNCNGRNCLYKMNFAEGTICTCPIRKELYNNHGI